MGSIRYPAVGTAVLVIAAGAVATPAAAASTLCVGGAGCYRTVQAAVDAAKPGATIRINAGTFAGGISVKKSLRIVGAGAGRTILKGGQTVLMIESTEGRPTVSVSGLTVTGGVRNDVSGATWEAIGGGILIPPTLAGEVGANVTVDGVRVVGNRAQALTTYPEPTGVPCPAGDCPLAWSSGGGIGNFGNLVLRNSVVRDNGAVGRISFAAGGGIYHAIGHLRIESSEISGNRATPDANRIGLEAIGGGVLVASGTFTLRRSKVSANTAELVTRYPSETRGEFLDMSANGGGIKIREGVPTVIEDSVIDGNLTRAVNPNADLSAFAAALVAGEDSPVAMRRTVVKGNTVTLRSATSEVTGPAGPVVALDSGGEVSDTQVTGNTVSVATTGGVASGVGALGVATGSPDGLVLRRVVVSGNSVSAQSDTGKARVTGAGVVSIAGALDLRNVTVSGNKGTALGRDAIAQGGGIWSGQMFPDLPAPTLSLFDSTVTQNSVATSPKGEAKGGGIYAQSRVTLVRTRVAGNRPDDCVGCSAAATPKAAPFGGKGQGPRAQGGARLHGSPLLKHLEGR